MSQPSISKNSLYLYLRLIVTLGISLYSSRVLLSALGVEDFGIYNVIAGFISIASFFRNTLVDATQRFLSIEIGKNAISAIRKVFSMSVYIHALLSVVLLLLFSTAGLWFVDNKLVYPPERLTAVHFVYLAVVFNFICNVMSTPYMATIVSYELMNVYSFLSIFSVTLKLIIILVIDYVTGIDKLILYSFLLTLITFIELVIQVLYVKHRFPFIKIEAQWDKSLFRSMLGFSGWNAIGSFSILMISQGSNVILNMFFGPVINAANGIAYQVMGAVRQFSSSFQSAINPRLIKLYAQNKITQMLDLCIIGSKASFFLFILIGIPLCYKINYVLNLWLTDVPDYTALFCILVLFTASIEAYGYPIITVIRGANKLKGYQLWVSAVLLLALPISYIFMKIGFDAYVVFVVNASLTLIASITRILYLNKCFDFNLRIFMSKLLLPMLLVLVLAVSINALLFLYETENFIIVAIQCCISVILTALIIYGVGLNKIERSYINNKINKIICRNH